MQLGQDEPASSRGVGPCLVCAMICYAMLRYALARASPRTLAVGDFLFKKCSADGVMPPKVYKKSVSSEI